MDAALDRMGNYQDKDGRAVTVHGFRSTFKDWAREQTNFADELSEAALAHQKGDKTYEAYARGDLFEKRHLLMEAWSAYCTNAAARDNVVSFQDGAALVGATG